MGSSSESSGSARTLRELSASTLLLEGELIDGNSQLLKMLHEWDLPLFALQK